jgi:hypothetical protein
MLDRNVFVLPGPMSVPCAVRENGRRLLDFMTCNSEFRNGKLVVRLKKPFDVLAESGGA